VIYLPGGFAEESSGAFGRRSATLGQRMTGVCRGISTGVIGSDFDPEGFSSFGATGVLLA
jgi:hypothetical protein